MRRRISHFLVFMRNILTNTVNP